MTLDKLAFVMSLKNNASGGGSSNPIDTQVNSESENAVQNKAIYDFVNSSVSSNTAYFKGTYNSISELETIVDATTNDYAFVVSVDSDGNTVYNRYKYNGSNWLFEYALNNSSFTANQWETINSGITSTDIQNLQDIKVDKVSGMGLSKNDYTDEEKQKLSELENYDDTGIREDIAINRNTLGYTSKNLLKVTASTTTVNGVTMTVDSNGVLTLSGTATERTVINITSRTNRNPISSLPTNFILSGGDQMLGAECCIGVEVSTGANSGYVASFYDGDTGRTVDLSDYPTAKYWYALVRIESGINVDGITIYPMIRDARISDAEYVPYSKPSIDERVSALEDSIVKLDSMDEFNALTDKTADWYFIKEG